MPCVNPDPFRTILDTVVYKVDSSNPFSVGPVETHQIRVRLVRSVSANNGKTPLDIRKDPGHFWIETALYSSYP